MPNWKKVIVSGSDASLTDVTIDGWGSVSASLASIEAGGASQTLQDVTDNGSTTTNSITSSDISIDDWGSISASLASINSTGSSQNLQQVTDNGAITTNAITVPELTLTGSLKIGRGNGSYSTNLAIGNNALNNNTNGTSNLAIGRQTLRDNTTGRLNTAVGEGALKLNTTGRFNTAIGVNALGAGEDARYNVAVGEGALFYNDNGEDNVAIGVNAGWLTAASQPNLYPSESIFIGFEAMSAYNANINMIVIGHRAVGRGDNTVVIGNSRTTDNYFFGNISGSDVTIDDWGSVSASLAALNSEATSVTLQEVLNASNGNAIASGSIYLTASLVAGEYEYSVLQAGTVVAEEGGGIISTPNTSSPSSHFTTALTMGSPHSASVASSLKANAGFNTDYRGQRRQLFPSDYIIAASQSMYVEYAEGANENDQGTAYFQVNLDTKSPEYLLPLTSSRLYVRAGTLSQPPPLTVEENIVITSSSPTYGGLLDFGELTSISSERYTVNTGGSTGLVSYPLASYIGVKFDYVVYLGARDGGSNITHRAGTFTATWDEPGNISYSETSTTDNQTGVGIPSTSGFTLVAQSGVGNTCQIAAYNTTGYVATLIIQTTAFKAPY